MKTRRGSIDWTPARRAAGMEWTRRAGMRVLHMRPAFRQVETVCGEPPARFRHGARWTRAMYPVDWGDLVPTDVCQRCARGLVQRFAESLMGPKSARRRKVTQ